MILKQEIFWNLATSFGLFLINSIKGKKPKKVIYSEHHKKWNILKNFAEWNFIPLYIIYEGRGMYLLINSHVTLLKEMEIPVEGDILHNPSRYKEISKQEQG